MGGVSSGVFQYDGNFKRVKQVVDGDTVYSIYSKSGQLLGRHNVTGAKTTDYLDIGGKTIAKLETLAGVSNTRTYLHDDHLGTPSLGTKGDGTEKWRESYLPFGEKWLSDAANDNDRAFTGHVHDTASGLTYMQARYYHPITGRFLSNDPVGFAQGGPAYFNRYAYTANDPVNATDPDGEKGHKSRNL